MHHSLELLLCNNTNVLLKVVGILRRRGLCIESLHLSQTADREVSRLRAVVGGESVPEQLRLQLDRQVEVLRVLECAEVPAAGALHAGD